METPILPGLRRQGSLCQAGGDREARVQGSRGVEDLMN